MGVGIHSILDFMLINFCVGNWGESNTETIRRDSHDMLKDLSFALGK